MAHEALSDIELDEIKTLCDLFSDIPREVVVAAFIHEDRDYKATQQKLADIATNPSAAPQLLPVSSCATGQMARAPLPTSLSSDGRVRSQDFGCSGVTATGLAALAMQPAPCDSDKSASGMYLTSLDVNNLTEALTQVGNTVSDSIASFATNLTGWVADLASAFDASWGVDNDDEEDRPIQTSDKNEPAVGFGSGLGIERPYQRRLAANVTTADHGPSNSWVSNGRMDADAEEQDSNGWEADDYAKDD